MKPANTCSKTSDLMECGDLSPLLTSRLAGSQKGMDAGRGTRDAGRGGGVTSPAVQSGDKSPHSITRHIARRSLSACATLVFALFLLALPPATVRAGPLDAPGPLITEAGEWRWLFSAIVAKGNTYSTFTENRFFTARKTPTVLTGEMRLIPATGLSLHYTAPEETLTLIDTRGLRLRDAKGRVREIKAGSRDAGLVAALLPVMRFDEENLFKHFIIHAARDGCDAPATATTENKKQVPGEAGSPTTKNSESDAAAAGVTAPTESSENVTAAGWRFDFIPRDAKLAASLGSIVVTGAGAEIRRLSFNASPKVRVEVLVGETKTGVTFSGDELKKYFR